jgi:hypothetical protein
MKFNGDKRCFSAAKETFVIADEFILLVARENKRKKITFQKKMFQNYLANRFFKEIKALVIFALTSSSGTSNTKACMNVQIWRALGG